MIGRQISHYRILETLGSGGMGTVYRADDTRLGRPVALKFPHGERVRAADARRDWIASARAATGLHHHNIVETYEVDEAEGEVFLAMEYVSGRSLRDRLDLGPVPLRETLAIGRAVAGALAHAHAAGIVHGDLKPENIVIAADGTAKVADFLPPLGDATGDQMDVTPEYIAPEVATGGTPGEATDLYGLGLLLFEMISGAPPFADASVSGVLDRIVNEPTPPLPPAAPTALQALIEALLAKHPSRRPANAGDVAETLARIARGGAAQASGR